ncbi:twin-arginine translocase subunit TatC [Bacillus marinisedimentorum]|uniref:twin-arginine translocase subunit TatC n=1 Tax=Bacillus marinisedimentorum TaxID=1821260 RepID=UPI0007DEB1CB|nr:twin-arginine translocase subunit TatC [Bacillus marinisedimentorum]
MGDRDLTVVQHLEELRKRLMYTVAAFVLFFIVGFIFIKDIYRWFVRDIEFQLTVLGPTEIIWIYFALATVIAVTGMVPVLVSQVWLFVKPALNKMEQRTTLMYIPASFILFVAGLAFGYFIVFPVVLGFLIELSGDMFQLTFTTQKYFTFLLRMTIPFAVLFELPVVIMFLTSLGLINPVKLKKVRKYAYFVLVVVSVIISPPDFLSDILVIVPLLLLYELSIMLSGFVYRRKQRKLKKLYEE